VLSLLYLLLESILVYAGRSTECAAFVCYVVFLDTTVGGVVVKFKIVHSNFITINSKLRAVISVTIIIVVKVNAFASSISQASFLVSSIALCLLCIT
jgi:hypothetical protein